jgi:type II secretory pathway component PulF
MRINFVAVSRFAFSMATCLRSGLAPRRSLELSAAAAGSPPLSRAAANAAKACDEGISISDGLLPAARWLPPFFIPVLQAGELCGRHVEAFELIHQHCNRLEPSLRLLRNTWLYPVICIGTGWVVRIALLLYFGKTNLAWQLLQQVLLTGLGSALVLWAIFQVRALRNLADAVLVQLPLFREALMRVAAVLFFSTFRLGYEAGGLHVVQTFDLALATVPNHTLRKDFAQAREVLNEGGGFEEAFSVPSSFDDTIKGTIAAGALSGHLGKSLEQIVRTETMELEVSLSKFNNLFQRLVAYGVAMSVVGTLLICLF